MAYNSKYTGEQVEELLGIIPSLEKAINTHNKEVKFFCVETVVVKVGDVEHTCEANQIATVFVGDEEFEIIPTSNQSIKSLLGYPIPLTWYDWLEGVDMFENIVFDMNELDTYKHWIQYYQGEYHVQKAQYSNCIFWSDKPYTHSPFEERTNYTLYYSAELPLCYSRIPENTYKPFYLAYGVNTDSNWNNPDYVNSYSLVSGATQTFSYYGATAIGIFDMGVDIIKLPKDCRGLMYHAPAITHAGVFDAINTTNFGAKKGSWQEAFGDCISLVSLYIKNLKTSINISWSPINNESIEFILNNAANTSAITISVSPYTWYRLTDSIRDLAKSKNITLALITTNYSDDARWTTKQDVLISGENIKTVNGQSILGSGDLPIDLSGYATTEALDGKVDKIEGKQLSTEDFTFTLKSKLEGLNNYDDTTISKAVDKLRTDLDATAIPLGGVVPIATEISSITSTSHSINYQTNSGKSLNGGYAGLYYLMCNHIVISQPFGWFGSTPMFRYPIKVHPLVLQSGAAVAISNVWQDVFIDIVPNTTTLEPYIINIYDSSGEKLTSHNLANCYIRGVRLGSFG